MNNEFEEALSLLNACIGSVKCEVKITSYEGFFADCLYYRCREFMKAYDEHNYGRTDLRRG